MKAAGVVVVAVDGPDAVQVRVHPVTWMLPDPLQVFPLSDPVTVQLYVPALE